MQTYEMMCIFDPKVSGDAETTTMVESILEESGATEVIREDLGMKRLAYLINKRSEGHYFLFRFLLDQQAVTAVRKELGIKESLLRYLLIRREA
jgi:small subunit ribosomal protein S6